ncbi:UPF0193 protein EVG1 homolog [Centruroides sculpturatus]|uniref:UPF0193 protein EVG1 homolog n=1 Tax=Centruroides sculpturatus TaxID=218467 RepID=UPI000C6D6B83|nr:UPF0193 protein EVG1 homolog [Centruroides sculpturatus]
MMEENQVVNERFLSFLKSMMKDEKLSIRCQEEFVNIIQKNTKIKKKPIRRFIRKFVPDSFIKLNSCSSKRTKDTIEKLGAYEREMFRPTPSSIKSDEKERLQNIMATGKQKIESSIPAKRLEKEDEDKFSEILNEIKEREEFLNEMQQIGMGERYNSLISNQIFQKIDELYRIDKKKCKKIGLLKFQNFKRSSILNYGV